MRILVAHNVGRARTGGMSRMLGFIHDELEAKGHEVDYLCAEDLPERMRGRLARFSFPALVLERARQAHGEGRSYDVVNVHEPVSAAIATGKKWVGNPRVVVISHGVERRAWELALEEARLGREGPSRWSRVVYPMTSLWQSTIGLRSADHILCLNEEDRSFLESRIGVDKERITRVFPAADRTFLEAARDRDHSGRSKLLFSGTWRKNKGIEDLVPAFETLALRHPELELVVLGAGVPPERVLGDFAAGVRNRVRVATARSDEEFARVYAEADLFILPSLFEGTPQTLLEAMVSGLPIVTTKTCGMRDVIQDEDTGLFIPIRSPARIASAVERLMQDEALRRRLGQNARREAVENYTWPIVAERVLGVYESARRAA